jgi:hypothetical protein
MSEGNVPMESVIRVLEQQFPKELTIAIQQVRIDLLQAALNAPHDHDHDHTHDGTDA